MRRPAADFVSAMSARNGTRLGQCPPHSRPQRPSHPCAHRGRCLGRRTVSTPRPRSTSDHCRPREHGRGPSSCRIPKLTMRPTSVDQLEPLVLREVGEVLDVQSRQRKITHDTAGGDPRVVRWSRRPRSCACACSSPQRRATRALYGRTTKPARNSSNVDRLVGPQCRTKVYLVSSPSVTNVIAGVGPTSWPRSVEGSR